MKKLNIMIISPSLTGGHGSGGGIAIITKSILSLFKQDIKYSLSYIEARGGYLKLFIPFFLFKGFLKIIIYKLINKIDLAHVHIANKGSVFRKILFSELLSLLNIPFIFHLHNDKEIYLKSSPWIKSLVIRNFNKASKIIVLGKLWKKILIRKMNLPNKKIEVLRNTTQPLILNTKKNKKNDFIKILFIGKICKEKGAYDLISVLNNIKNIKNWSAILAGDGDVEETKIILSKQNIDHRVKILGWVNPIKSHKLLIESDILILPSYAENLPISVIEGMSYKLPIITTSVGVITEIIKNNKTGIIIKPGDTKALTINLKKLINLPKLRFKLGKAAQRYYKSNLSFKVYKKKLKDIWQDSIK